MKNSFTITYSKESSPSAGKHENLLNVQQVLDLISAHHLDSVKIQSW